MHTYAHMQFYHMHICAHMCTCAHVCTHTGGGGRGEHGAWSDARPSRSQGSDAALPHVHVHEDACACACASPLRPQRRDAHCSLAHMHTCTRTYAICTMCTCTRTPQTHILINMLMMHLSYLPCRSDTHAHAQSCRVRVQGCILLNYRMHASLSHYRMHRMHASL